MRLVNPLSDSSLDPLSTLPHQDSTRYSGIGIRRGSISLLQLTLQFHSSVPSSLSSPSTSSTIIPSAAHELSAHAAHLAQRLWGSLRTATAGGSFSSSSPLPSSSHEPLSSSPSLNRDNAGLPCDRRIVAICSFLESIDKKGPEGVIKEFHKVDHFFDTTASHKAFHSNMNKNRYSDVPCIDDSRIRVRLGCTQHGDYVHANRVVSPFICTQGPTQHTVHDFWRMVFQERAKNIVMLCKPVEDGKPKCTVYWPEKKGEVKRLPCVIVTNEGKDTEDEFLTTTFRVELNPRYDAAADGMGEDECRPVTVKMLRWTEWPDRGVPSPQSCLVPLRILQRVREWPCLVHCSAGIGRTGCLIAIEMALQRLSSGRHLAIHHIVRSLRCQRSHSIQTDTQYLYIHKVLVEACLQVGCPWWWQSLPPRPLPPGAIAPPSRDIAHTLPYSARCAGHSFLRRCEKISS